MCDAQTVERAAGVVGEHPRPADRGAGACHLGAPDRAWTHRAHAGCAPRQGGDDRFGHPDALGGDPLGRRRGHRMRDGGATTRSARRGPGGAGARGVGASDGVGGAGEAGSVASDALRRGGGVVRGQPAVSASGQGSARDGAARFARVGQPLHRARGRHRPGRVDPAALGFARRGEPARDAPHRCRPQGVYLPPRRSRAGLARAGNLRVRSVPAGPALLAGFTRAAIAN